MKVRMILEPSKHPITIAEDLLFDDLAQTERYRKGLYLDGVPVPECYAAQQHRVLFVFREPNLLALGKEMVRWDMRAEVRGDDPTYRPSERRGWWRHKVGLLAHAVSAAQNGVSAENGFREFEAERDASVGGPAKYLFPFAYMQIRKTGGAGVQIASEIEKCAHEHRDSLRRQIDLYDPEFVVGCGVGRGSPACLIAGQVCSDVFTRPATVSAGGYHSWQAGSTDRPRAMLEFNHPSARKSPRDQYHRMWDAFAVMTSSPNAR